MRLITFRDYDGQTVSVRADLIESVRRPSGRVHDHGGLMVTTGRSYSFESDSTAERVERELQEAEGQSGR